MKTTPQQLMLAAIMSVLEKGLGVSRHQIQSMSLDYCEKTNSWNLAVDYRGEGIKPNEQQS